MTPKPAQFPPHVWVKNDQTTHPNATFFVAKHEKFDAHEYLSKAESDALVSQARKEAAAEAYEDAAAWMQGYTSEVFTNATAQKLVKKDLLHKAQALRGERGKDNQ